MVHYILRAENNPEEFVFSGNDLEKIKGFFINLKLNLIEIENQIYEVSVKGIQNNHTYNVQAESLEQAQYVFFDRYVSCELVQ